MDREPGGAGEELEPVPISALNHYLYCARRCALIHIEGMFPLNQYVAEGLELHERVDLPEGSVEEGVRVERALPLYADRLGLVGKADVVEFHGRHPMPVEYKRGTRRQWDNDDVQLCAQALCLEEMTGEPVGEGAVFHHGSRRRRVVELTPELRARTVETIESVRELLRQGVTPPAVVKPQCDGCSLRPVCLPEITGEPAVVTAYLAEA